MTQLSFTDEKGQAVTEFAIFLPMYLLLIFGMIFFAKGYFIKQQTVSAARYGAFDNEEHSEEKIKKYFFRELKADKATFDVSNKGSNFEDKMSNGGASGEILGALTGALGSISGTKGYKVGYQLDVSKGLQSFLSENANPNSECYVDHNCWSWNEDVHGLIGLAINAFESALSSNSN